MFDTTKRSGRKILCAAALGLGLSVTLAATPALAAEGGLAGALSALRAASTESAPAAAVDPAVAEAWVGSWELISMQSPDMPEGLDADAMLGLLQAMGMSFQLDINADGTYSLIMSMGDEMETQMGTWTASDATELSLDTDGYIETVVMQADGSMLLAQGEGDQMVSMTFARSEDIAAGKFDAPALGGVASFVEDPEGFVYTWQMVAMDMPGEDNDIPEELFSLASTLGIGGTIQFTEDGTFVLSLIQGMGEDPQVIEGTYVATSDDTAELSVPGAEGTIIVEIDDARLKMSSPDDTSGTVMLFAALADTAQGTNADIDLEVLEAAVANFSGEWAFAGAMYDDPEDSISGEGYDLAEDLGMSGMYASVNADGTFTMVVPGTQADGSDAMVTMGTWSVVDATTATLTVNGEDATAVYEGDALILGSEDEDSYLVFLKM